MTHGPHPRRTTRRLAAATALAAVAITAACRPAAPAFGETRETAAANSGSFFHGLAARFTNVTRTPKFAAARSRLSRHALSPSGIFGDTAVWTAAAADSRTLTLNGRLRGNRYVFDASSTVAVPREPGDSWHLMRLRRLGGDQYEWSTAVDHHVGSATPDELLAVWRALLATAARTPAPLLRQEYRTYFPRATRAMGQLATVDSIDRRPLRDGSAVLVLHTSLQPERLAEHYPHFARYVVKYLRPARYSFTFADRAGNRWITMSARNDRFVFQLRTMPDGRLAPLEGPVRPLPDTLVMRGEAYAKLSVFTVGVSDLEADVVMVGTGRERGWDFRFREEPDWHFPLAVNNLIRTALRRPFQGEGMRLRLVLERRGDGHTLIARRTVTTVQEGAIVRWLGGLGEGAMSDFAGQAEEDENRFAVEVLTALGDDFAALLR